MRDLKAGASRRKLRTDFEAYLDGSSPNVQDVIDDFETGVPRWRRHVARGAGPAHATATATGGIVRLAPSGPPASSRVPCRVPAPFCDRLARA